MPARTGNDALRCSTAAFILQRHTRDFPGQTFTYQPRNLDAGSIVAKPAAVDVGYTIELGVVEATSRREGEIASQTVGGRETRPLADQHDNHARPKDGADLMAQSGPRSRRDHGMAAFEALGNQ